MATLSIVFKGEDEVAGVTKQVADDIGDVEKASDSAKESGTGFFGGMLQAASGFLLANVVGKITEQVGAFVSEGFSAARDTQQLMAQTETIIKNTGGAAGMSAQQVTDLATSLSDAAGKSLFGDDQIQGAENVLLKYKELKGIIPGVTTLAVDMAQSLGKDPAAAAEFLGRALQKPFDAAAKLAKEGIVLNDSQKATLEAFKKTGDTAGAQAFLMQQLNSTYAGSAQAAAQAAGGTVQFKARMGEVAENLATAALPLLDKLGGLLNDYVAPAIETVANWIGANLPAGIAIATEAINQVIAWFSQAGTKSDELSGVIGVLSDIWTQLAEVIGLEVELIQAIVVPAFEAIAQFLTDHGEEIKAVVDAAWTIIKSVIDIALGLIKGILKTALALIKGDWSGAWDAIKEMLSTVWTAMKTIIDTELGLIKGVLTAAWTAIKTAAETAWGAIKDAVSKIWDDIKTAAETKWNEIKLAIQDKIGELKRFFDGVPDQLVSVGAAIVTAIWDGIKGKWEEMTAWINDKIQKLKDALSNLTGMGGDTSGGGGSTEAPPGTGGPITGQSVAAPKMASLRSLGASASPAGETTVRIVFDAGGMQKLISATVETALAQSGNQSLSRIRTGG